MAVMEKIRGLWFLGNQNKEPAPAPGESLFARWKDRLFSKISNLTTTTPVRSGQHGQVEHEDQWVTMFKEKSTEQISASLTVNDDHKEEHIK
ncbi:hypothetical protein ACKF11_13810 [Methylobacillus sp. Pita2]|uniref:hypothetical protein n=1 Tax=Methylobacillus sp. Pita2 TaxID=3383245 RepID=UPI0038B68F5B